MSRVCCVAGLQNLTLRKCTALTSRTLDLLQTSSSLLSLDLGQCTWVNDSSMALLCTSASLKQLSLADCVRLTNAGVYLMPCADALHLYIFIIIILEATS
jgi:hypothetical protein